MPPSASRRISAAHVAHARRVEAGRRLVEHEQARRAQQRRGDPEPLAHAVRVAARLVARAAGEVDRVERGVDPAARVAAVERGHHLEVLAAAQVRVEARRLDEAGDAVERARALGLRVAPEQPHAAGVGADEPEQHPQRRRLAGAVGAEVAVDVAGPDRQVDAVDRDDVAVALDEARAPRSGGASPSIRSALIARAPPPRPRPAGPSRSTV